MIPLRLCALAVAALMLPILGCGAADRLDDVEFADRPFVDPGPAAKGAPASNDASAQAAAPALGENPALADYVAYADANNPGLAAGRARWKAALERVPQARTLDDPRLSYRAAIARDMRTHEVTVEQMFPWPGKLDLRASVAQQEANAAREQYEAERRKVVYRVKNAYYEYYYLARAIDVVRGNRDIVRQLSEIAAARYKTASAGYQDVVRAQVELGKLEDQLRTMEDSRGAAAARLNAALNRPPETPVPWPRAIPQEKIEVASDEQVVGWLRDASPELKAMEYDIARERQAVELAKKDYYPDVGLGVGYMNFLESPEQQDDHMVVGMVSVTLPIWREKYAAGVREARLRQHAAVKMRSDRENMLSSDIKMALYQLRDAGRKIDLYRDLLIPRARASLQATEAAFRTGGANFVDLVDGERMLLEFQLTYERSLADHAARLAELEMLVGRDMPRAQAPAPEKTKESPKSE